MAEVDIKLVQHRRFKKWLKRHSMRVLQFHCKWKMIVKREKQNTYKWVMVFILHRTLFAPNFYELRHKTHILLQVAFHFTVPT